uniref:XRE protein n=1 Tax=Frederiksenia canicola TaxID=123824 RepID=K9MQ84_9PAST|nr:helix-turn-helix transcriptional regulator [Frederiksenia canicola]AFW18070.1 XRE protein [Frederiksenia canicola]
MENNLVYALRKLRLSAGLTQEEMSSKLGISRSYLSEIEKRKKSISLDLLERYAEIFSVPVSSLMIFYDKKFENESEIAFFLRKKIAPSIHRLLKLV